jgi:hypothetical protein
MSDFSKILDVEVTHTLVEKSSVTYQKDDGPLTEKQIDALRNDVQNQLPLGQLLLKVSLFD